MTPTTRKNLEKLDKLKLDNSYRKAFIDSLRSSPRVSFAGPNLTPYTNVWETLSKISPQTSNTVASHNGKSKVLQPETDPSELPFKEKVKFYEKKSQTNNKR